MSAVAGSLPVEQSRSGGIAWAVEDRVQISVAREGPEESPGCHGNLSGAWILPERLPSAVLAGPQDVNKPFKLSQYLASNMRSFQHDYQETGISKELLRTSLADALAADDLHATNALLGNRVAVLHMDSQSAWICQQSGQIGELLSVSQVPASSDTVKTGASQAQKCKQFQCSGMPIWQLSGNHMGPGPDQPVLLAVRTAYWICILQLQQHAGTSIEGRASTAGWTMVPVAANQQKQRIADMAWSHCSPAQLAITCEDGSLHLLDVSARDPRRNLSAYASLQSCELAPATAARRLTPGQVPRVCCAWGPHPLQVIVAAGRELTCVHIPPPGRPARVRVILTLPEDEAFQCLTGFHQVGPVGVHIRHLLAAATARDVLLLNLLHPHRAVLVWRHHMHPYPPAFLQAIPVRLPAGEVNGEAEDGWSNHLSSYLQADQWGDQSHDAASLVRWPIQATIIATSLVNGEAMAFNFGQTGALKEMRARAPVAQQRSALDCLPGAMGTIQFGSLEQRRPPLSQPRTGGGGSLHLEWRLGASQGAVSLGKPRRLAKPIPLPIPHYLKGTRPSFWDAALALVSPQESCSDYIDHFNNAPRLQGLHVLPFAPAMQTRSSQQNRNPAEGPSDEAPPSGQDVDMAEAAEPSAESPTADAQTWAPKLFWILRSDAAGTLHLHEAQFPGPFLPRKRPQKQSSQQGRAFLAEAWKSTAVEGAEGEAAVSPEAAREAGLAIRRAHEERKLQHRKMREHALKQIKEVYVGQQEAKRQETAQEEASASFSSGPAEAAAPQRPPKNVLYFGQVMRLFQQWTRDWAAHMPDVMPSDLPTSQDTKAANPAAVPTPSRTEPPSSQTDVVQQPDIPSPQAADMLDASPVIDDTQTATPVSPGEPTSVSPIPLDTPSGFSAMEAGSAPDQDPQHAQQAADPVMRQEMLPSETFQPSKDQQEAAGASDARPAQHPDNLWHELGYKHMRQRLQALLEESKPRPGSVHRDKPMAAAARGEPSRSSHTGGGDAGPSTVPEMPASISGAAAPPSGSGPAAGPAGSGTLHQPNAAQQPAARKGILRRGFLDRPSPRPSESVGMRPASGPPASNSSQPLSASGHASQHASDPLSPVEQSATPARDAVTLQHDITKGKQPDGGHASLVQIPVESGPAEGHARQGPDLASEPSVEMAGDHPPAGVSAEEAAGASSEAAAHDLQQDPDAAVGLASAFDMSDLRAALQKFEGTMTLQQLHQQLVLDPLMAKEMAVPRQLKSYESSKAHVRHARKRDMLGSLHVLSGNDSGKMIDSMAALRSRVEELLQQQDDSQQTTSMPKRIGLDSSKRILLPQSFSPYLPARTGKIESKPHETPQPGASQDADVAGPSSQPEPGTMFSSQVAANVDSPYPNLDSLPPPRAKSPARPARRPPLPFKLPKGPPFLCSAPASRLYGGDCILFNMRQRQRVDGTLLPGNSWEPDEGMTPDVMFHLRRLESKAIDKTAPPAPAAAQAGPSRPRDPKAAPQRRVRFADPPLEAPAPPPAPPGSHPSGSHPSKRRRSATFVEGF
ncbi:hypothetical protein WJX74_004409 [Apatococcus lobatus]|uniref:Uncharacterized protein n=1 Tax=Apatococcus lobatus TaxID=904363 RepID=A0AAW1SEB1_9CHLO